MIFRFLCESETSDPTLPPLPKDCARVDEGKTVSTNNLPHGRVYELMV